jgi:hypothetical protein
MLGNYTGKTHQCNSGALMVVSIKDGGIWDKLKSYGELGHVKIEY